MFNIILVYFFVLFVLSLLLYIIIKRNTKIYQFNLLKIEEINYDFLKNFEINKNILYNFELSIDVLFSFRNSFYKNYINNNMHFYNYLTELISNYDELEKLIEKVDINKTKKINELKDSYSIQRKMCLFIKILSGILIILSLGLSIIIFNVKKCN